MNTLHITADGLRYRISAPTLVPFTNALPASTAPRTADEAAALLRAEGHHVHLVSDGDVDCPRSVCIPTPVRGLLAEPRELPHLNAPFPLT